MINSIGLLKDMIKHFEGHPFSMFPEEYDAADSSFVEEYLRWYYKKSGTAPWRTSEIRANTKDTID